MVTEAPIRLRNLRSLKLSAHELSDRVGGRYTYWRDMLNGTKSFGEKAARKIEDALGLSKGWLDSDGEAIAPATGEPHGLSTTAIELARLFDMLPDDRIARTVAYSAATAEILRVLQQHAVAPTASPVQVGTAEKRHA